ncbi:MAG TPA: CoA transferase [Phenylobacterium sp.]|nr:CoA transferase [Phenylobacterium sp.]
MTGLRVIELCSNIAGPVAGTIFGDLGADVVKVERPEGGDDVRGWAPPLWNGISARFRAVNRNKRSIALDLRRDADREALTRLVRQADVLLHNMRPGAMEALDLSADQALALNPRLIYCAISAFGAAGPWRERSGYDGLAQALSGQMAGNGQPDSEPTLVADALVDKGAGMWAAIGVLAALMRRGATGRGGVVETSLLEASLFWRDNVFAVYGASGRSPPRPGNGSQMIVPYGVYATADHPIMLGCAGDGLFALLARLLDRADWLMDPRFATNAARVAHRAEIEGQLTTVLQTRPRDAWVELLGGNRIPCGPILVTEEAYAHPQVQALGIFQSAPGADMPLVSAPWSLDGVRPPVWRGAPALGEDDFAVTEATWSEPAIAPPSIRSDAAGRDQAEGD